MHNNLPHKTSDCIQNSRNNSGKDWAGCSFKGRCRVILAMINCLDITEADYDMIFLFSVCSSARGNLPHSWGSWGRESNVKHPNAEPGMWMPGIKGFFNLSTEKAHACLDKPSGECKMLILLLKRRNASSWPLQLLTDVVHGMLMPTYFFVGRSHRATSFTVRGE